MRKLKNLTSQEMLDISGGNDTYVLFVDKGNGYEMRTYSSHASWSAFRNMFLSSGYSITKFPPVNTWI